MRKRVSIVLVSLVAALLAVSACGTCPPGIAENSANVEAVTAQNEALMTTSGLAESVVEAHRLRNREARELAAKLAAECAR